MRWAPVPGFETLYEISDCGAIRRLTRRYRSRYPAGSLLNPTLKPNGYLEASLVSSDGTKSWIYVHRLVALAFAGEPPDPRFIVCHNNGDPLDNRPENLRWDTHKSNSADMITHGNSRSKETHCKRGHEFTEANIYRRPGKPSHQRKCRTCNKMTPKEKREHDTGAP